MDFAEFRFIRVNNVGSSEIVARERRERGDGGEIERERGREQEQESERAREQEREVSSK